MWRGCGSGLEVWLTSSSHCTPTQNFRCSSLRLLLPSHTCRPLPPACSGGGPPGDSLGIIRKHFVTLCYSQDEEHPRTGKIRLSTCSCSLVFFCSLLLCFECQLLSLVALSSLYLGNFICGTSPHPPWLPCVSIATVYTLWHHTCQPHLACTILSSSTSPHHTTSTHTHPLTFPQHYTPTTIHPHPSTLCHDMFPHHQTLSTHSTLFPSTPIHLPP